jgi:hypothetical protein
MAASLESCMGDSGCIAGAGVQLGSSGDGAVGGALK